MIDDGITVITNVVGNQHSGDIAQQLRDAFNAGSPDKVSIQHSNTARYFCGCLMQPGRRQNMGNIGGSAIPGGGVPGERREIISAFICRCVQWLVKARSARQYDE